MAAATSLDLKDLSIKDEKSLQSGFHSEYTTPQEEPSEASTLQSAQPSAAASTDLSSAASDSEQPKGPVRIPLERPLSTCKPVERPPLTAEQGSKYAELHKRVQGWKNIPISTEKRAVQEPLTENERFWLTRECLLRYLRATNWSLDSAEKRVQDTLIWRREYKVEEITGELVSVESETGKQHIFGFDNDARPCLYMNPGKQNTKKSERQIQHMVFMLERVIDMMPPGQETSALLINFRGATSGGSPSVGQGKQVLNILQGHYPERLGKACIAELPWYINTFFKLISPFIDPVTREKMVFNQDLRKYIPPSQLDPEYGGDAEFEYDHKQYWPALCRMCEERRIAMKQRWLKAGGKIGEYEMYLKGGDHLSLAELQRGVEEAIPIGSKGSTSAPQKVAQ
ncbi:MAG: hypothetical protein Q9159_003502 [Coniocarpon cinnabarinum]